MFADPLQSDCPPAAPLADSDNSDWEDEPLPEQMPYLDKRRAVLQWSCEQVKMWLLQNVPFSDHRMQECLHAFDTHSVDGIGLLTLQKSHRACVGMTDFEWLFFKAARRKLLSGKKGNEHLLCSHMDLSRTPMSTEMLPLTPPCIQTPPWTPMKDDTRTLSPRSPFSLRSSSSSESSSSRLVAEHTRSKNLFGFPKWISSSDRKKNEQIEVLGAEVQSLRGEIVRAEERQSTLQAQMHHVDYVLRTAALTGYMYTRTRWVPLFGEHMVEDEDADADDWLQRFLVMQGASIFFYLRATDLRPQGTILLDDVIAAGMIVPQVQNPNEGHSPFAFYITTCHGLRLECSTVSSLQAQSWLSLLGVEMKLVQQEETTDSF